MCLYVCVLYNSCHVWLISLTIASPSRQLSGPQAWSKAWGAGLEVTQPGLKGLGLDCLQLSLCGDDRGCCKDATALHGGDQERETAGHKRKTDGNVDEELGVIISWHVVIAAEHSISWVVFVMPLKRRNRHLSHSLGIVCQKSALLHHSKLVSVAAATKSVLRKSSFKNEAWHHHIFSIDLSNDVHSVALKAS